MDYKNNNFHQDHLHPASKFDNLSDADKTKYGWGIYNSILNLQMLDSNENMSKNNTDLKDWVEIQIKNYDKKRFLEDHIIPDVDLSISNFGEFIETRKEILTSKLISLIN